MTDAMAFLGIFGMMASFVSGYLMARHYTWSNKTNQLVSIYEIKTSEGIKKV